MVIIMKKTINYFSILLLIISLFSIKVTAKDKTIYVNLDELSYSTNNKNYKSITEYKTLEDFLEDYNNSKLPDIYITDFLFDGVSSVKTPDLDDFIESNSNDTNIDTLKIKVININTTGNIEFSGEIKGAMLGIDTNNKKGNINIILNNVSKILIQKKLLLYMFIIKTRIIQIAK